MKATAPKRAVEGQAGLWSRRQRPPRTGKCAAPCLARPRRAEGSSAAVWAPPAPIAAPAAAERRDRSGAPLVLPCAACCRRGTHRGICDRRKSQWDRSTRSRNRAGTCRSTLGRSRGRGCRICATTFSFISATRRLSCRISATLTSVCIGKSTQSSPARSNRSRTRFSVAPTSPRKRRIYWMIGSSVISAQATCRQWLPSKTGHRSNRGVSARPDA